MVETRLRGEPRNRGVAVYFLGNCALNDVRALLPKCDSVTFTQL
jgi:hypothetical protein